MKLIGLLVLLLVVWAPTLAAEPKFARTCVKATQTERGRMADVSVAATSGYASTDVFALNMVKVFRLELKKSEYVPRQTGFVIVDLFEDGSFASTVFKHRGRLVHGCADPTPVENGFGT